MLPDRGPRLGPLARKARVAAAQATLSMRAPDRTLSPMGRPRPDPTPASIWSRRSATVHDLGSVEFASRGQRRSGRSSRSTQAASADASLAMTGAGPASLDSPAIAEAQPLANADRREELADAAPAPQAIAVDKSARTRRLPTLRSTSPRPRTIRSQTARLRP